MLRIRMHPLLRRARSLLRETSFDVMRFTSASHPLARRKQLFERHAIDVLLDVGANAGQYATEMRDLGYRGWIVSFEPLASAFRELAEIAKRDREAKWRAVPIGLGPAAGQATLHVAGNSLSSSLLPMLAQHVQSAPESAVVGTETVTLQTLASALDSCRDLGTRPFVKIDAQGYERKIVESGGDALERVVGLQLEMSLVPLYEGESLMTEIITYLETVGFVPMSLEPGYTDPQTGRMLQVDGVFFRS
jgi:FkbM family methyltransferase